MTATCDSCGCDLVRVDSKAVGFCAECRLIARNEDESPADLRRRIVAERLAELLEAGGELA